MIQSIGAAHVMRHFLWADANIFTPSRCNRSKIYSTVTHDKAWMLTPVWLFLYTGVCSEAAEEYRTMKYIYRMMCAQAWCITGLCFQGRDWAWHVAEETLAPRLCCRLLCEVTAFAWPLDRTRTHKIFISSVHIWELGHCSAWHHFATQQFLLMGTGLFVLE